jgi:adenosylcobinamide kinase / adenosylcobinamide-phosphate guanylyltransferase
MSAPLVVILGGTRSGKSRFGRDRAAALSNGGPVAYLATALPGDPELDARIGLHRRDRPAGWQTLEPTLELPGAVRALDEHATILLDGLTLWVSRLLPDGRVPDVFAIADGPIEELRRALADHAGPAIVVSDEIGLGLVPLDPLSRAFRDILGIAHQRLVADSDEAWFMVAGRAIALPAAPVDGPGRAP